jgi:hypothetical protein
MNPFVMGGGNPIVHVATRIHVHVSVHVKTYMYAHHSVEPFVVH